MILKKIFRMKNLHNLNTRDKQKFKQCWTKEKFQMVTHTLGRPPMEVFLTTFLKMWFLDKFLAKQLTTQSNLKAAHHYPCTDLFLANQLILWSLYMIHNLPNQIHLQTKLSSNNKNRYRIM